MRRAIIPGISRDILLLAFLLVPAVVAAQAFSSHPSFVIDRWGVENGLPVNSVVKIIQSEEGYLWLVTHDGLVRFDGIRFEVYQTDKYPGLPSNRLINLKEAPDGSIWLGSEQNFQAMYKNGEFRHIREADGLNGNEGIIMQNAPSGLLWIGSDKGISMYDGHSLAPWEPDLIKDRVDRLFIQKNGTVWYRDQGSLNLYRVENGEKRHIHTSTDIQDLMPFYEDKEGAVWFGSGLDIWVFRHDSLQHYSRLGPPAHSSISGIGQDGSGAIWVASYNNGFYKLENGQALHFAPSKGEEYSFLPAFHLQEEHAFWMFSLQGAWLNGEKIIDVPTGINTYTFDREGNLWIGSVSEGLIRLKPNLFKTFSTGEGLPHRNVYPVLEDKEGTIWIGTLGGGVARIKDGKVLQGPPLHGVQQQYIWAWSLAQTSDGTVILGTIGNGVFELKPGSSVFTKMETPRELAHANISAIYQPKNGSLWLGTDWGIYRRAEAGWEQFREDTRLYNHPVRYFLEGPDSSLWMGTNGAGLIRYKNGSFEIFSTQEGFTSNLVRSLYISETPSAKQYTLWAGTEDLGLVRLEVNDGKPDLSNITVYSRNAGMLDYVVHVILEDDFGQFWFNTNRGIFRIEKAQLEAFHRGEITTLKGITYNESDGLRNREGNGGVQWPGIKASDGKLWLPGQDGIVVADPAKVAISANNYIPPVIIEELITGSKSILNTRHSAIKLAPKERDFEISFTSLSLENPEKNKFRYRLKGFNDNWLDADERRTAIYTNIPAGRYTFEVMGSNNTGLWNLHAASMPLEIAPYFYETLWFRMLLLLLGGFVFYMAIRLRVHRLQKNEEVLTKLVADRTQQLEREKQKTQEQANRLQELDRAKSRFFANISHELRTPLTLIKSPLQHLLVSKPDQFDTETQTKFRQMLRNSDRLLRLIDQTLELTRLEHGKLKLRVKELDLNQFLLNLQDLFLPVSEEKGIDLTFQPAFSAHKTVPIFADPDKLDKIVANLISNAIKFTPPGGRVQITLEETDAAVQISVTDTGIGISANDLQHIFERFYQVDSSETRSYEGSGIGLSLAYDFAQLHHGKLTARSEPGEGSTFLLELPKGNAHFTANELLAGADEMDTNPELRPLHLATQNGDTHTEITAETEHEADFPEHKASILIVEDNPELRSFIRALFAGTWRVTEARNGKEAFEKIASELPDLVIADIMMPEMDGLTFNQELKTNPETASIPLIFLTAKTTKSDQLAGFENGADDYITKPFDPELLKARAQNLMQSRFRLRELLLAENRNARAAVQVAENPFMAKIKAITAAGFSNPDFNVSKLVEQMYLDRSQVFRKLKSYTGLSPAEYIRKYRMEEAARLLNERAGSISEVAYGVGYKSLAHFSYTFRAYHNLTPSEFLSNVDENGQHQ